MTQIVTIYAITRTESGHAYVGSTISLSERWSEHRTDLKRGRHHCRHLQHAWTLYGQDAFAFSVLEQLECSTRQERYLAELSWIAEMGYYNHLVPSERSGQFCLSMDARARRREKTLQKMAMDPTYRAFLDARGKAIGLLAKSPEGRVRTAEQTKRRWEDPELRKALQKGLKNRWANPQAREHMSRVTGERMRSGDAAQKHSEKMKAAWADPEKASRLRKRLEARWADPDAKARAAEKMRQIWAARRAAKAPSS